MGRYFTTAAAILVITGLWVNFSRGGILYYADYEEGDILDGRYYGIAAEKCCRHSISVVYNMARRGKASCRFESRREDPPVAMSPGRAELKVRRTNPVIEQWYAWSIYIPLEMQSDYSEILGQWHEFPDFKEGETWRTPPLSIELKWDKWIIAGYYVEKRVSSDKDKQEAFVKTLNSVRKNVWTDWVFHIKWDYRSRANGGTGFLEAWQQVAGKGYRKIVDYRGPIGYNDQSGVYLKWGLYKGSWRHGGGLQSPRYCYYDELKIGDEKSSFSEMKVPE